MHLEIAGCYRERDLWRILQQQLYAWAASDMSFLCRIQDRDWSHLLPPLSLQLLSVLSAESLHLSVPPGVPELQSCLTQGHSLPRGAHIQWLLQVGIPRHSAFDPVWDNSDGHSSSRDPCGFGSACCWTTRLFVLSNPGSFSSFTQGLLPRTLLNKHPVH